MAKKYLSYLPNVIAGAFFLLLFIRAITTIDTYWDSLAYHLPFAARLVGIMDKGEFILPLQIEEYYAGFPKLSELFQGIFWGLSGRVAGTNLASLFSILLVAVVASYRLRIRFWQVTLVIFSVPLIVIHSTTSYIDIIAGSFFSLGIINFLASVDKNKYTVQEYFIAGIPFALAANTKYNISVLSIFALVFITIWFIYKSNIFGAKDWKKLCQFLTIGLIVATLLSGFMINNWIRFNNPVFPLNAKIGPIQFVGGERSPYQYDAKDTRSLSRLTTFVVSLSEIPLWEQNPVTPWIIDMSNFITEKGSSLYRIGGYFWANMILWWFIVILGIFLRKDTKVLIYAIGLFLLFLFVGFMPSSMMLRYWLFLPIVLGVFSIFLIEHKIRNKKAIQVVFTLLQMFIFAFVIYKTQDFIIPNSFTDEEKVLQSYALDISEKGFCISDNPPLGFLYKIANMDITVQSVGVLDKCEYPMLDTLIQKP